MTLQYMSFRILCTLTCLMSAGIAYAEELAPDASTVVNDCFASVHDAWRGSEACEAALTHALTDVEHAQATASLAMIKAREANLPVARELMNQALGAAPTDPMVMTNHGSLLLREREFAAAVVAYDAVLAQQFDKATGCGPRYI
jgi:lipopolysaccharide biosynthesis regulator YciM